MWWLLISVALAAPVSPDTVVSAALQRSPEVAAAQARVEAARGARAGSGGLRENPELQVGMSVDGSRLQGQLVQPVSLTGEGSNDRRASTAGLDASEAALERARFVAAAEARSAYAGLALAEAGLRIAEKQLDGATRLRVAAEARLAAGEAPRLDAQLARLEEARAVSVWLEAGGLAAAARTDLAVLTGLAADVEVAADPLVAASGLAERDPAVKRSDVRAAEARVGAAEATLARERSAIVAPVGLGAFYESDEGQVVAGPQVTVRLPLWKQNPAGLGQARGGVLVAHAELDAAEARAASETLATSGRIAATARARALLPDDLAADAVAALSAIQQGYALGEMDLNTALLLQGRAIEGERGWYAARAAVAEARIEVALAREDSSLVGGTPPSE